MELVEELRKKGYIVQKVKNKYGSVVYQVREYKTLKLKYIITVIP